MRFFGGYFGGCELVETNDEIAEVVLNLFEAFIKDTYYHLIFLFGYVKPKLRFEAAKRLPTFTIRGMIGCF